MNRHWGHRPRASEPTLKERASKAQSQSLKVRQKKITLKIEPWSKKNDDDCRGAALRPVQAGD